MNFVMVNNVLQLTNTEMKFLDFLRCLKENEANLPNTNSDEIIKLALIVVENNK